MSEYQPYPSPDPAHWNVGQVSAELSDTKYTFTSLDSLVTYFGQWFPREWIHALVEAEKQVFVVRRECSLEETQLQFLKKCENTITRVLNQRQNPGAHEGWSAA